MTVQCLMFLKKIRSLSISFPSVLLCYNLEYSLLPGRPIGRISCITTHMFFKIWIALVQLLPKVGLSMPHFLKQDNSKVEISSCCLFSSCNLQSFSESDSRYCFAMHKGAKQTKISSVKASVKISVNFHIN